MKKNLALLLTCLMVFSLCACGETSTESISQTNTPSPTESVPAETVVPIEESTQDEETLAKAEDYVAQMGDLSPIQYSVKCENGFYHVIIIEPGLACWEYLSNEGNPKAIRGWASRKSLVSRLSTGLSDILYDGNSELIARVDMYDTKDEINNDTARLGALSLGVIVTDNGTSEMRDDYPAADNTLTAAVSILDEHTISDGPLKRVTEYSNGWYTVTCTYAGVDTDIEGAREGKPSDKEAWDEVIKMCAEMCSLAHDIFEGYGHGEVKVVFNIVSDKNADVIYQSIVDGKTVYDFTTLGVLNESNESDNLSVIRNAIDGAVGDGEEILDVEYDGNNLIVRVDMSGANTSIFPVRDIALSRISSITDNILKLNDSIYNSWETITIDFGSVGKAILDKRMIKDQGYGKYFDFPDSILK